MTFVLTSKFALDIFLELTILIFTKAEWTRHSLATGREGISPFVLCLFAYPLLFQGNSPQARA